MHKIPTLFKRDYDGNRLVYNEVVEGCEWVVSGEGQATEKFDGTSCLVNASGYFKRYDAKAGKTPPDGFIPAQDAPDEVTGHWPGWLRVGDGNEDKWHREGYHNSVESLPRGTYELVGPKVQGNPYRLEHHELWRHGVQKLPDAPRDFDGLRDWLATHEVEGIVWHHPDGRMCKLKRRDFGLPWPVNAKG